MALVSLDWNVTSDRAGSKLAARDIHLTPGLTSPRLDQLLWIQTDTGDPVRADQRPDDATWTVAFTTSLHPASPQLIQDIVVDDATGEVTVGAVPAFLRGRSFIITAIVADGASQMRVRIRVHLHEAVAKTWLTPSSLTVRQGASNMRFSVLAQFDDGVIGDVTNWSPTLSAPLFPGDLTFVRGGATDPVHRWSGTYPSGLPQIQVSAITGALSCPAPTAAATVNVHVGQGPPIASATAFGAVPWSTPVPLTAVAGPGFGAMARTDIHNVLFLPDGFTDDPLSTDRIDFEAYVRGVVHLLNTNATTTPYDVLSAKFNYFSAWVPSPQAGISALAEAYTVFPPDPSTGNLIAYDLELPEPPTGTPPALTVQQLMDTVGPPVPLADPVTEPKGTDAAGLVHDWQQFYGPLPTAARVSDVVYRQWLHRDTRVLINERDTAFHVANDNRPRIEANPNETQDMEFHPLRIGSTDFNTFLRALADRDGNPLDLTDEHGTVIPPVWAEGGKNDALVVIVCRTNRYGGQNNFHGKARYLCVPVEGEETHVIRAAVNGVDLVPDEVPNHVDVNAWGIIAHELAHTFTLDDEYSSGNSMSPERLVQIQAAANVQEEDALDVFGELSARAIKWNWKRQREAGVLVAPGVRPDPATNGQYLISVAPGHGAAFLGPLAGVVRLRKRTPRENPTESVALRVVSVDHDQLTVRDVAGSTLDPAGFGDGDLVFAPVRTADPDYPHDVFGDELGMVSQVVIDRINATHNPLNAAAGDRPNRPCVVPAVGHEHDVIPATNFVTRPNPPRLADRRPVRGRIHARLRRLPPDRALHDEPVALLPGPGRPDHAGAVLPGLHVRAGGSDRSVRARPGRRRLCPQLSATAGTGSVTVRRKVSCSSPI